MDKASWSDKVALFSSFVAAFAVVATLLSGRFSHRAMIKQIEASDSWSHYQAKSVKMAILDNKIQVLKEFGKQPLVSDEQKLLEYKNDQDEIALKARDFEIQSKHYLAVLDIMTRTVTLFQASIAMAAIAALTRKRFLLGMSVFASVMALGFFIQAWFTV